MGDTDVLEIRFTFRKRPSDIPADLRPNWRIPVLLLMLRKCCRGGKSSLFRLHVLNWALRADANREALLGNLTQVPNYESVRFRVEPSFVRAIQFAIAEELVERVTGDHVRLTAKGLGLVHAIYEETTTLSEEKEFFEKVGFRVTEDWVKQLSKWGRAA